MTPTLPRVALAFNDYRIVIVDKGARPASPDIFAVLEYRTGTNAMGETTWTKVCEQRADGKERSDVDPQSYDMTVIVHDLLQALVKQLETKQ